MTSLTEENYLKALFHLSLRDGSVSVKDLSGDLGIKMPTVTSMMKKLAEKELVIYESYKPLRLTSKGKKAAGIIVRKHRLTEMYLVEQMGFGWEEVHEIAEQIEHVHAPLLFDRMDKILGFPKIDPHGSPIPDKNGKLEWKEYNKLSDCRVNDKFELQAVTNADDDFLKYLNNRELSLGQFLIIQEIEDFDGSMVVKYSDEKSETLSLKVCERLLGEIK